jgi:phosphoribosylformylglycinamidine (FGAM) synthase PurS component
MRCSATIAIALKEGMPNPEARAIRHALANPRLPTEDRVKLFKPMIAYTEEHGHRKNTYKEFLL